jgi:hypothetical protein
VSAQGGKVFVVDETEDLVCRLRVWAAAAAEERGVQLPERATAEQIADAEAMLGYALHPLLGRLYLEIANGGFGPDGWRLMPVERLTMCPRTDVPSGQPRGWPDLVVAVMDVGCAMLSAVDCGDPGGQVLLMDPNAFDSGQPEAWSLDAATLAHWLEAWLDGSSWLVEQDTEIEDIDWPVPWSDAAARLGAVRSNGHD